MMNNKLKIVSAILSFYLLQAILVIATIPGV